MEGRIAKAGMRTGDRPGKEPFLGVYRWRGAPSYYIAFAGARRDFKEGMVFSYGSKSESFGIDLISLKRVPKAWKEDLLRHSKEGKAENRLAIIGGIQYFGIDEVAMTFSYYPRSKLGKGPAPGLPYFIEAITTHDLKVQGYSHVCTTSGPEPPRVNQLKKVGLPIIVDVEIQEWLKGMGRGIRISLKNQEKSL
ncbi:MAG: hypothetical protein KGH74_02185 [Candidatus Micrarchaeota archaeon]|nr:hypothetical protein [Candidatus Micrarchaeota archaeon]